MTLADFLRTHSLDEYQFATAVGGVSASAVRKWKYGERVPRPAHLSRIMAVTDGQVTPNDFLNVPRPSRAPSDGSGAPTDAIGAVPPAAPVASLPLGDAA